MKNPQTAYLRETKAANVLARKGLDNEGYQRWKECYHGHRFQGFYHKAMVVFTLEDGQPNVIDKLTCKGLSVDLIKGFTSSWYDNKHKEILVGHTPKEVAKGCFMYHLQESPVDYSEYAGRLEVKFPVIFKTFRSPNYPVLVAGSVYMLEDNVYDNVFGV